MPISRSSFGTKEFAFTRMIACGLCGSGIVADEKFKKLKDGGVNRLLNIFSLDKLPLIIFELVSTQFGLLCITKRLICLIFRVGKLRV